MRFIWLGIYLCIFGGMTEADDLQKDAEKGNVDAQCDLGLKLLGDEDPENDTDGMKWLDMSASAGNLKASYNLGAFYQDGVPTKGTPVKKDASRALLHLHVAAELGEVRAMNRLAGIYYVGEITPQNDVVAVKWAVIASGLGSKTAQDNLAQMKPQLDQRSMVLGGQMAASWVERRKPVLFPEGKK